MRCIIHPCGIRVLQLVVITTALTCWCGAAEAFELREITATNGQAGDFFGTDVDIFDGTVIVGNGFGGNAAYLYDFASGALLTQLLPDDPANLSSFGGAVAINADTALVGDISNLDPDLLANEGAVYAFNPATGGQTAKLREVNSITGDFFGISVALGNGFAVGGAVNNAVSNVNFSGSVTVFDTANLADFSGQLFAAVPPVEGGGFGMSVAASGPNFVVGARGGVGSDDLNLEYLGTAFVFNSGSVTPLQELIPEDRAVNDGFGGSVAIDGTTVLVSSFSEDGSVYVFDTTTGAQLLKLTPDDTSAGFGSSVAIAGNLALIGSSLDDEAGAEAGAVYLFDLTTGAQLHKIFAPDAQAGERFGNSVALFGNQAIVGAFRSDSDTGAAFLFTVPEPTSAALLLAMLSPALLYRRAAGNRLRTSATGIGNRF